MVVVVDGIDFTVTDTFTVTIDVTVIITVTIDVTVIDFTVTAPA